MLSRRHQVGSLGIYCPTLLFQNVLSPIVQDLDAKLCPHCQLWELAESISENTLGLPDLTMQNLKCEPSYAIDYLLANRKVLVVEDNPVSMKTLLKTIYNLNKNILQASNGAEAFKWIVNEEGGASDVGLILLDMDMPVMDGNGFIEEVYHCFGKLPFAVILVSELKNWAQARALIDRGVLSSIKKPYTKDAVFNTVLNSLLFFNNGKPMGS